MYRIPSRRRNKREDTKLNLTPILDAVFIFIFFLLMSANFIKIFEINSNVPIISSKSPPPAKKPLALTLQISHTNIVVMTGIPSVVRRSFGKNQDGEYDLESLHSYLVNLKKRYIQEDSVILEPLVNISYEKIVKIMDTVRTLKNTDDALYKVNKSGIEERLKLLFDKIIFGNLMS
ncbi:MAG: biopolymer transporter ExbD [Bacteriovoracaceae bacterium]|jgi:biopolymer transport protein ExbD|nr:biopolymer transporter ExbD [Bacteriovoracaceae bacterium]